MATYGDQTRCLVAVLTKVGSTAYVRSARPGFTVVRAAGRGRTRRAPEAREYAPDELVDVCVFNDGDGNGLPPHVSGEDVQRAVPAAMIMPASREVEGHDAPIPVPLAEAAELIGRAVRAADIQPSPADMDLATAPGAGGAFPRHCFFQREFPSLAPAPAQAPRQLLSGQPRPGPEHQTDGHAAPAASERAAPPPSEDRTHDRQPERPATAAAEAAVAAAGLPALQALQQLLQAGGMPQLGSVQPQQAESLPRQRHSSLHDSGDDDVPEKYIQVCCCAHGVFWPVVSLCLRSMLDDVLGVAYVTPCVSMYSCRMRVYIRLPRCPTPSQFISRVYDFDACLKMEGERAWDETETWGGT